MLKLEQIDIKESSTLIAEILEPIVYPQVGSVHKTDEIITREKANVHYLLAKVVKVSTNLPKQQTANVTPIEDTDPVYNVNDIIMIPRSSMSPITFPIGGYSSPKLAVISTYSIFAIIKEEMAHCNPPQDQV